jgi:hypothetical protein
MFAGEKTLTNCWEGDQVMEVLLSLLHRGGETGIVQHQLLFIPK